jgi:Ca2+-binding EF-hand superfamily protein
VHDVLQQLGIKVPKFEINKILEKHDRNKDGHLSKDEFEDVRRTSFFSEYSNIFLALFEITC